ncbi:MAG: hypothetical protein E6K60_00460 [Nitrospirae bacterium]|nr:MAG: hypothetical protein E6K60_00460 [Nitrospirota bacterium]
MELRFALQGGTCAGVVLANGLFDQFGGKIGRPCTSTEKDLPVVFHIANQEALDRVLTRFGLAEY